ncbi:MAG: SpoIIE family protein phosphatase [Crocinitomicaceae bacterium]|nr:SpoIIE family protein phosphatase [Flavobacteriales bacterium]NQZ37585.1 SpoIIE family protein phosphatase [Crocinitomicaceae bacterium]
MRFLLFSFFLLFFGFNGFSQNFRFNEFGIEDGMAQNFIYSMDQDAKGYLWIGTGEGLCRFDGQNFKTFTTKDGLAEDLVTSTFIGSDDILWIGHNSGELSRHDDGGITSFGDNSKVISTINGLSVQGKDVLFVSQNEGLFSLVSGKYVKIGKFDASHFYAIEHLDESNLILGTDKGLIHLIKSNNKWTKGKSYLKDRQISSITQSKLNRNLFAATKDGILCQLKLSGDKLMIRQWDADYLGDTEIRSVIQDNQMNLWVGTTRKGLIKIPITAINGSGDNTVIYNTKTGLNSDVIQTVFQDREGSVWIGSFGAGLSSMSDDFFTFYEYKNENQARNVTSILMDGDYRWFGTKTGLIRTNLNGTGELNITIPNGLLELTITALYAREHKLYVGTKKSGIYVVEQNETTAKKVEWNLGKLCDQVNQIDANADFLWVATNGGLVSFDLETYETEVYGTESGLGHNAIQTVMVDHLGDIWIGTYSRFVYKITEIGIDQIELVDVGQLQVKCIVEDLEYHVWVGTAESGVFKLEKGKIEHFSMRDGLNSNYIYSLKNDVNNNMWVGHRGALSKILVKDNSITTYDYNFGIQGQINTRAMSLDRNYDLWIGTDNGAIQYNASKDVNNELPPIISLVKIWIDDKAYDPTEEILLPYGSYRIQFEYIGVSLKDSKKITYKFMLKGHDDVFSDATKEMTASYSRLSDGEYTFYVNAYNGQGVGNSTPANIRIVISKPFWKQVWFILLVLLAFVGIIYGFIQYRTSRLQKAKELLQVQLKEKTKEVVEKAEKIHLINKDLTDSINYAERIQKSILPNVNLLHETLPNSYLFFQPRDVVSGDFYFIERINNKLIIACADCTGHGVPGAFVSMIGSVTLRNIYSMAKFQWKTPDEVLEQLDEEVQNILHRKYQGIESEPDLLQADGMDISLCEIDLDTNEVLIASAKRTSLIRRNGKIEKLKGDNRSIGGHDLMKTKFTLNRFKLEKGDALYLFTDGFTDQFGGTNDKKLMISGVLEMLEALEEVNREHHFQAIRSNFALWKSTTPQVDDVLFIGLLF